MGVAADELHLSNFSESDARFDTKKALADKVADLYSLDGYQGVKGCVSGSRTIFFDSYAARIQLCGSWLKFGVFENGSTKLLDARFCKVPACPMCQWRRSKLWRAIFFSQMPAIAKIIELEPLQKVTWEVTILPGFYARHTYYMEDLGNGRTRFGSWEKATGWSFRLMKWFWIPHFVFVKDCSLEGTRLLEKTYSHHGMLHHSVLAKKSYWKFFTVLILLLLTLIGGSFAGWFYLSYVQQKAIELAPGVHVVLGGGGNSLVVEDNNDVLLVDTKFPPGSETLQKWIAKNVKHPVTKIIDTHYHYDHTQGNILYPDAQIFAQKNVPDLMRLRDNSWWKEHENGIPSEKNLIDQTSSLKVGNQEITLHYPGIAHTHGDLYVYLPKQNIVATGDLFFNTYYPFFDTGKGGVSIPKMILAIRNIADKYPNAVFMPGHGSIANANDLRRYADY